MLKEITKSRTNKLLKFMLICFFIFSMALPAQAAGDGSGTGANPLTFMGANLTTTNHLTELNLLNQTSSPGVSLVDNNNVPSGPQTIDIWIDKNIITDAHYAQNTACITLKDVNTSSNAALTFFRLGATDGTGVYKQHIYFDATLIGGHNYTITIDAALTANNGLTLLTTKYVNFSVASVLGKPALPTVSRDDTLNTVSGMATGMEYNLDAAGYVTYNKTTFDALNFSGVHSLVVRVAAAGSNPASDEVTLIFTTNPVSVKPFPDQQNVALNKEWRVSFSQIVDSSTILNNIELWRTDSLTKIKIEKLSITPTVDPNDSRIVIINHTTPFVAGTSYELSVNTSVKGMSGKTLSNAISFSFTTQS